MSLINVTVILVILAAILALVFSKASETNINIARNLLAAEVGLFSCRVSYRHRRCIFASEFGWRPGMRTKGHGTSGNISALEQSLLGLLALFVGFTFLMALARFEERREAVLNEANAIGTTAFRARLLPKPHRTESLKLLRQYAQIRIDYIPTGKSFAELPTFIDRSNNIQEALWQQVKAPSAKDNNMVPAGLFIQALTR
jgi:hypothetical protein